MNVLIFDIDSLRQDHLGCYGYDRPTSPTIDAIADAGVRFDDCYVSNSPCLPSRTALVTCRRGIKTGVVTHEGEGQWYESPGSGHDPDDDRITSFRLLSETGIRTASVSSFSQRHLAPHFAGAFRETIQPTAQTGLEGGGDVTDAAVRWLRSTVDNGSDADDWLLHLNYWDVHLPYEDVESFVDSVRGDGPPPGLPDEDLIERHRSMTGPRTANLWPTPRNLSDETHGQFREDAWEMPTDELDRETVEHVVDGYDSSVQKADAEIRAVLDELERLGIRDETVVVVTADHGEAFGEHGLYGTHGMAHPATQRVPLIVSWPGTDDDMAGTATDAMVYQFDLMATLCDLFDIPIPDGWDARPFTPALSGIEFDGREFVVCGHGTQTLSRALYTDDWLYVQLVHPGVFSFPGTFNDTSLPAEGLELLHARDGDPHHAENLVVEKPAVAKRLRRTMAEWTADQLRTPDAAGTDPLVEMATNEGPFIYVRPDELRALYAERGELAEHAAILDRSETAFPRPLADLGDARLPQ
ncbi:sulfatase family protein [Halococcus agarilyticus]|uniref:sulfatase family protein n=1 Tax=Halococcus agarilyticus TaxID=1232219 RepID=UPI0006779374|nr:sulfatase [Halococcus agarilyticus]